MTSPEGTHDDGRALVNEWLGHLGRQTRLSLRLDADGVCTVGHSSGLDCVVEVPGDGSVYLRVGILPWEPEAHPDLAERCLVAQFMGRDTHGASFGVDPLDGELVLWRTCPVVSLDAFSFSALLVQLLNTAVHWRSGLPAAEEEDERAAVIDADRPADFSLLRA